VLATRYSELVDMSVADLQDQLKKRKLAGAKGYNVTQPNRTAAGGGVVCSSFVLAAGGAAFFYFFLYIFGHNF